MECVEGGLKSSFLGVAGDDFLAGNGVAGDDFFVDGLLDFSDDGDFEEENENTQNPNDYYNTTTTTTNNNNNNNEKPFSNNDEIIAGFSLPENDLCLPADDVADLEWVSHFVDDSFSGGYSLTCTAGAGGGGKLPEKKPETEPENIVTVVKKPSFTSPVHTKARSKRTRTGGRVWSLGSSPFTDSSTSSSSSSSCTSNPWLFFHDSNQTAESIFGKKPVKRQKKKNPSPAAAEPAGSGPHPPRRCSHCLVQKTPQWRAGPLGAKTLCNACGVRYKSGRLLPEYRPACSPTFSSEVHSNNHRKVLEMRQKKEAGDVPGLTHPVQSF